MADLKKRLKIEYKPVDELIMYANNPRKNDGAALDAVVASIKEFGFKNPIVIDKDNVIVAGHTRLKAAKKLKMEEVPTIMADDLTPAQVKAFRLADNKVGELAEWDAELLGIELEGLQIEGFDMTGFCFDDGLGKEQSEVIEDEAPEVEEDKPTISKLGDIWQLGRHRVMCGDSTDEGCVKKLTGGHKWICCSQIHLTGSTMLAKLKMRSKLRMMPRATQNLLTS